MSKQVAVIGLGRFGSSIALSLCDMGHEVLAIDSDQKAVQALVARVTHVVQADATSEATLRQLGVEHFQMAVIAIGSDIQASVMATLLVKRLGVPFVVARAQAEIHASILEKIGADRVIQPEQEMGHRLAHELVLPYVRDYMELVADYGVTKVDAPPPFIGQTLNDLGLGIKGKYGVVPLAIQRGKELILTPDRFERVQKGDLLVLAGRDVQVEKLVPQTAKPTQP